MSEAVTPAFNSSLDYLTRISNLIWSAHIACMDKNTVADEFTILQQLDIELNPRMNAGEIKACEELRLACKYSLNTEKIRLYFLFLNNLAHSKKLIMKDNEQAPAVVKNTR